MLRGCACCQAIGDGRLTPERMASLEEVREKMGLAKETATKIIAGISSERVGSGLQVPTLTTDHHCMMSAPETAVFGCCKQ